MEKETNRLSHSPETVQQGAMRWGQGPRRYVLVVAVVIFVMAIIQILVAWTIGIWQYLATGLISLLGSIGYLWIYRRAVHRPEMADRLVWGVPFVLIPVYALFWSSVTLQLALTAFLVQLLVEEFLHRRGNLYVTWSIALSSAALTLAAGVVPFWSRYDVTQFWLSHLILSAMPWLAVVVVLVSLFRAKYRLDTIQGRLIAAFVVVVLLVVGITSAGSIMITRRNAIEQAYDQLESMILLKEAAVDSWVKDLFLDLDILLGEQYEMDNAQILLVGDHSESLIFDTRQLLRVRFVHSVSHVQRFDELFLMNLDGKVVLSSDQTQEGKFLTYEPYFQLGSQERYVHPPVYSASRGDYALVVVQPVIDQYGTLLGVLGGRVNMDTLNDIIVGTTPVGRSGEAYLVGINHALITNLRFDERRYLYSDGIDAVLREQVLGWSEYEGYKGVPVLGVYKWLPSINVALLVEMERGDAIEGTQVTMLVNGIVAVLAALLAVFVANFFMRDISSALTNLSRIAKRIAGGEHGLVAEVNRDDEIGVLADSFNRMTAQLQESIEGLERRVEERTQSLEAVAEVSRATTSVLDSEKLLPQVVTLVQERFHLYYVGLFLVDDTGEYAVLRAGTGDAGRQMMGQDWKLAIGGESMIGQCVATGRPGVRQTEGDKVVRFENPYLLDTRSELALPLRYGNQVIGAMTVQSVQESAFDKTAISLLQNMADQVAVAVENARLFATTQQALSRAYEVQRRYQAQAWEEYMDARQVTGYALHANQFEPLSEALLPDARRVLQERKSLVSSGKLLVPIIQDDRVVGVLGFENQEGQQEWGAEEIALVEALSEQLMLAAENQRLLDQTQRSAARERTISEVTGRVRQALDMQGVLRTAVDELQHILNLERVVVRMVPREELDL